MKNRSIAKETEAAALVVTEHISRQILVVRGQKVMIDADLAALYDVPTKRLNQQVKRNAERIPKDFVFQFSRAQRDEVLAMCDHLRRLKLFCSNSAILQCMKATVTITSRGVITLPAKLRQALGLKAEDHLIAETTPEGLLLRPAVTLPVEMYTPERVREFDAAEQELAAYLGAKSKVVKRVAPSKRKSAR